MYHLACGQFKVLKLMKPIIIKTAQCLYLGTCPNSAKQVTDLANTSSSCVNGGLISYSSKVKQTSPVHETVIRTANQVSRSKVSDDTVSVHSMARSGEVRVRGQSDSGVDEVEKSMNEDKDNEDDQDNVDETGGKKKRRRRRRRKRSRGKQELSAMRPTLVLMMILRYILRTKKNFPTLEEV